MKKVLFTALLIGVIPTSHATVFNFSFTSAINGTLTGQIDGVLQADNNTIIVNSILDFASLNGLSGPTLPYVNSTDFINFGTPGLSPVVTLDGSYMDIIASNLAGGAGDGFTFNEGNATAANFGTGGEGFYATSGFFGGGVGGGGFSENFDAANWSISVSSVPEPATLGLLGIGAIGFLSGISRRRFESTYNPA